MQSLRQLAEQFLTLFDVDGTYVVFGNTVSDHTFAFLIFVFSLTIFALAQFFSVAWLSSIAERTTTTVDNAVVKVIRSFKPPFYLFLSFWFSIHYVTLSALVTDIVSAVLVLWLVYQAVIIVGILVEDVVFRHLIQEEDEATQSAISVLANLAKAAMWVMGVLLILSNFGVNITSLMAGAGIAGIAIAFALQGILADLFSSFSLYFDKPFKVGDFVIVGDTMGVVKHIGIKSTRIQALSGEENTLSNQELTKAKIRNFKRMQERRAAFTFGVVYETPTEKIRAIPELLRSIVESQQGARFDRTHFYKFGESSLDFEVVYFLSDPDYVLFMDIQQEINVRIMERFAEEGISFAYPTRTVHNISHSVGS